MTTMTTRALGPNGLRVGAIGYGCMGLSQGYGPADDEESIRVLRAALDAGVSLLDTAMSYRSGHNEELVGRAVAGRRDEVALATKFGIVRGPDGVQLDAHPDRVAGFCEGSLRRLGVEHLDLYYLHRVDPQIPIEETVGAMARLAEAGKVGHLGVSEVDAEQLARAAAVHPITAVQLEWSLSWREPERDVIPAARRLGVGIVPYSPLGRGLLTGRLPDTGFGAGDMRAGDGRFAEGNLEHNRTLVGGLEKLAADLGTTVAGLALAWLLAQGDDVVPVPGTRRRDRMAENLRAADLRLDVADLRRVEALAPADAWRGDRRSFAAHGVTRRPTGTTGRGRSQPT